MTVALAAWLSVLSQPVSYFGYLSCATRMETFESGRCISDSENSVVGAGKAVTQYEQSVARHMHGTCSGPERSNTEEMLRDAPEGFEGDRGRARESKWDGGI